MARDTTLRAQCCGGGGGGGGSVFFGGLVLHIMHRAWGNTTFVWLPTRLHHLEIINYRHQR